MPSAPRGNDLPLPAAVLALLGVVLLTALVLMARPEPPRAELTIWTFAASHAQAIRQPAPDAGPSLAARFEQETGRSVAVELMPPRAMDLRLTTLLRSDAEPGDLPDVIQLEANSASRYLAGQPQEIGLMPLNHLLERDGLADALLPSRLSTWSRDGLVYGIPLDVHPTTLTYRRDLFEQAGVDPSACRTWPELAEALREYQAYWQGHGHPHRRGLELLRSRSDHLSLMLQQRGIEVVDSEGQPRLDDPRIAAVLVFYAGLVAGDEPVGLSTSEGHARWAHDLARGDVGMIWTPDWRLQLLEEATPELVGRLAMMPLPVFESGDSPTATWGGTMLAIPRNVHDPEAAWQLLKLLAFDESALAARAREGYVIPPLPGRWDRPEHRSINAFFGRQPVMSLYTELADHVPPNPVSPLTLAAKGHLSVIISRAADHLDRGGTLQSLETRLQDWLASAQSDLLRRRVFLE